MPRLVRVDVVGKIGKSCGRMMRKSQEGLIQLAEMKIPQLGESVTEGLLASWLKQVGDHVDVDEPLLEVTTDKVNVEIPSEYSGTIAEIFVPEGSTVQNGTVVCRITVDGE
jgi:2-oxoisovalerate dehydrogenase E2 component (dihydrolipoyl transacylase)